MWIEKDGSLATEGTHLQVSRLALTNIISQKISVKISVKSCYTKLSHPALRSYSRHLQVSFLK